MKDLIVAAQAGGADLTAQVLSCGFIDIVVLALIAVEKVGAENVHGCVIVCGLVWTMSVIEGEALPQIEDKLRAIPSALRYMKDSKITQVSDVGMTAGTFATIVAGEFRALRVLFLAL
jgi:hypothetical protein